MKKEIIVCNNCKKEWSYSSPPTQEQYENGFLYIENGMVLLPERIVKMRHKDGITDSYVAEISGDYCNIDCLVKKIKKIFNNQI